MTFEKLNTKMKWKEIRSFVSPIETLLKKAFWHFEAEEFEICEKPF